MTNKSLSEKICEVCGIEEQKIIVVGFDEHDITLPIFKTVKQTSDEPCIRVVREHCLPDFENAENFKKLFNLKYGRSSWETVAYRLMKCPYQIKDTTEFLEKFLNMLKYHKCYDTEQIIKAIKQTKWEV